MGPTADLDGFEEKILLALLGFEPWIIQSVTYPVHQLHYPSSPYQLHYFCAQFYIPFIMLTMKIKIQVLQDVKLCQLVTLFYWQSAHSTVYQIILLMH